MTVSTTANSIQYAGNGVTTSFSFPYVFFADTDLVVTLFIVATNLDAVPAPVLNGVATYDYAISGTFDPDLGEYPAGANVVFNTAPPTGYRIVIVREVPATQDVSLVDNSKFPAQTVNGEFDKLTVLTQQALSASDRALVIPASDPPTINTTIPVALDRASKYLGFDTLGNPVAIAAAASTALISSFWQTILLLTTAPASRLALGFSAIAAKGDLWVGTAVDTIGTLTAGNNGQVLMRRSATTSGLAWDGPFQNYLSGLITSRASATTIGVTAGACMDSTNVQLLTLSSGTINLATTGADGLDTGALANNTWYHDFAIGKTDGTSSRIASTSATTPSPMPSGYTLMRRIGSFRTNGSAQVTAYVQNGDRFTWDVPVNDVAAASNPGTSAVTRTLTVPTGVVVDAWFSNYESNITSNRFVLWTALDQTDSTPSITIFSLNVSSTTTSLAFNGEFYVKTNASAQIRYRTSVSGASDVTNVSTKGWIDPRGK